MPSINTPASKHAGPAATMGWQWLPYTNATMLAALKRAIRIIDLRIKGSKPCNAAFQALPSGRTFAQVWSDPSIWINYDPDRGGHRFGVTHSIGGTHNISVTQYALSMGEWTTAATLIHELAHATFSDLELPHWLDEGVAQMMEGRSVVQDVYNLPEIREDKALWAEKGLGDFWLGKSFHDPQLQRASYWLSRTLVQHLVDECGPQFREFLINASRVDSGHIAAKKLLGIDLEFYAQRHVAR